MAAHARSAPIRQPAVLGVAVLWHGTAHAQAAGPLECAIDPLHATHSVIDCCARQDTRAVPFKTTFGMSILLCHDRQMQRYTSAAFVLLTRRGQATLCNLTVIRHPALICICNAAQELLQPMLQHVAIDVFSSVSHLKVVRTQPCQLAGVIGEAVAVAAGAHDAVWGTSAGPALIVAPCSSKHFLETLRCSMVHWTAGRACCRREHACMHQARPITC